ncbi:MAG: ATP-binding protein [Parvularcula sp.]|nr:ATP-binding protein [Parvularcula sp.]
MTDQLGFGFMGALSDALAELMTPREIWERATVADLSRLSEDRRIEFKRGRVSRTDLAKYYSMFSNTTPEGGVVFVGVDDNGVPTGMMSESVSDRNAVENFHIQMCPGSKPEFRRIE